MFSNLKFIKRSIILITIIRHNMSSNVSVNKTKSTTASVHTNLCISICLSQVLITISLSKFNFDSRICQSFALLNHYVFITIFAWLMNEAFNLYITITYAAHQTSPLNDSGSQWKFYLLGWLIPAIIVFIIFLTNSDDYFHDKMCWFNLDNIWINVSPALSILAISILVMVFSAKEHTEISYTKTEKSNKASFLFIFYFLLNEEVRKKLRESKKLERLEKKEKKSQMSNLNDLIMETMFKIKRDEIDEEEEDDEEDEEEEQVETKTRNSFSKLYKSSQKNYIKSPTNDSKGNDLWLKSTNSKTVKFESPLSQGRNSHARDPLVLDLNSTAKKNEMMHLVLNPSDEDNRDYENQVWPHLKEKYYKNSSICLNKFNSVNLGADFYESNEEKITSSSTFS
ncbi:adhesion G -coupled receptor L2-like [Brachionus plicatilis]|uniref:Adhesion G-coupled receptor L2-like n=1 Tax=Brachionus plicatilis TaxID=10195 RepID=A0A3M7S451_BRAPC|nr:adhesion G -coupled receptor L2-like [Brachionus plicatilis]